SRPGWQRRADRPPAPRPRRRCRPAARRGPPGTGDGYDAAPACGPRLRGPPGSWRSARYPQARRDYVRTSGRFASGSPFAFLHSSRADAAVLRHARQPGHQVGPFLRVLDARISHLGAGQCAEWILQEAIQSFLGPDDTRTGHRPRIGIVRQTARPTPQKAAMLRPAAVAVERVAGDASLIDLLAPPRIGRLRRRRRCSSEDGGEKNESG